MPWHVRLEGVDSVLLPRGSERSNAGFRLGMKHLNPPRHSSSPKTLTLFYLLILKTFRSVVHTYGCVACNCVDHHACSACRVQKRVSDSLELGLWATLSVLENKPGSSCRAASVPNHGATSPVPPIPSYHSHGNRFLNVKWLLILVFQHLTSPKQLCLLTLTV